jgi:ferritin
MLAGEVETAMNRQLGMELSSAYVYLSMSAYCEAQSLPGFARWLRTQAQEEVGHGLRFFDFLCDRGGRVRLQALEQPTQDFKSVLGVFEQALENERSVTRSIADLYSVSVDQKDYAAQAWLDWFATEQVEEEKTVGQIVDSLRRVGDRGDALYLLDRELGGRTTE